jgi:hypothetical protein
MFDVPRQNPLFVVCRLVKKTEKISFQAILCLLSFLSISNNQAKTTEEK